MTVPGIATNTKTGTPYDTAAPFLSQASMPSWIGNQLDRLRVASYDLYDAIYRNVSGTFKLVARGTENNPIYIPAGKTIVEACNRYLAVGFDYHITGSTDTERKAARAALDKVFRRNKFLSKFATQKRYGLIRGDALWHIIAYPDRSDPFARIVMYELDPRTYFPITALDNVDEVEGCIIIKRMADPVDPSRQIVKRQRYLINDDGTIQSQMDYYPIDAWDDRVDPATLKPYQQNVHTYPTDARRGEEPWDFPLDERITALPVYHIKNSRAPQDPFGVSEMSGIERIIAAVNQGISDEELALALDGLGLYSTNSGPPQDEQGNDTNWVLGPGRVVEIEENAEFKRVSGVTSVAAPIQHLEWLTKAMRENSGTADVAVGIVNQSTQMSGIALALQMAPLLAKNAEKESEMLGEYDLMLSDILLRWMPVYGVFTPADGLDVVPTVEDPMPVDRTAIVTEVTTLVDSNIITIAEAQSILEDRLGYEFNFSSMEDFMKQVKALTIARDPFGSRLADENGDIGDATRDPNAVPPALATPPSPAAGA